MHGGLAAQSMDSRARSMGAIRGARCGLQRAKEIFYDPITDINSEGDQMVAVHCRLKTK